MKCLVYQVSVGTPPNYYKYCIGTVKKYCEKYGIDHIIQTEPILKIRPVKSCRSSQAVERYGYLPIYEKENAFGYLDKYDKICIIDSDIAIRDNAPNIFDEIDMNTDFAGAIERDMPITPKYASKLVKYTQGQYDRLRNEADFKWNSRGAEFYNMGLMLFTSNLKKYLKGQTPLEFIRRKEFERLVNGEGLWKWSTDQTLLNYWVRKEKMKQRHLSWKWNALFKGVKDEVLKDSYFVHFFLSVHLPRHGEEIPSIMNDLDKANNIQGRT